MIVMPSNQTGFLMGWIAGAFKGRFAHLINACDWRHTPFLFVPWAMDNGKFAVWSAGKEWNEPEFWRRALALYAQRPMWVVVPDVVGDRYGTLKEWYRCSGRLENHGHTLAMAVQDGMTPDDVPANAGVVFVGGTTKWKWRHIKMWTANFKRVHVGRVGSERMLWMAHEAGAESCDSTGWGREGYGSNRIKGLLRYLENSGTDQRQQTDMFSEATTGTRSFATRLNNRGNDEKGIEAG